MATINYIGDGGSDGMVVRASGTSGLKVGEAATELISFHGVPAVDQAALVTLEVTVSASVIASRVKSIIALLIEKGLMASA